MAARRPFWKWHRWKSIGFCLWPPSICIWNLKLKFQSKLDLCSGNHVVYRQTDRRTDGRTRWIQYTPPSNFVGRGYNEALLPIMLTHWSREMDICITLVTQPGHHWFRQWLGTEQAPSHYLNQCWIIVDWALRNKLQWNSKQNTKLLIHKNASENIFCKMLAILSRVRWVKASQC